MQVIVNEKPIFGDRELAWIGRVRRPRHGQHCDRKGDGDAARPCLARGFIGTPPAVRSRRAAGPRGRDPCRQASIPHALTPRYFRRTRTRAPVRTMRTEHRGRGPRPWYRHRLAASGTIEALHGFAAKAQRLGIARIRRRPALGEFDQFVPPALDGKRRGAHEIRQDRDICAARTARRRAADGRRSTDLLQGSGRESSAPATSNNCRSSRACET